MLHIFISVKITVYDLIKVLHFTFALVEVRLKKKAAPAACSREGQHAVKANVNFTKLFPWFILCFVALAIVNSLGVIPPAVAAGAKSLSKFLMIAALAAIGFNTRNNDQRTFSNLLPVIL